MSDNETQYWKSLDERGGRIHPAGELEELHGEFLPAADRPSRRGFLKAAGFSVAAAALAGCSRAPVEKAIPYLVQPEEIVPGRAVYYASTCRGCAASCGVLVKTRDGRPIKLEGNPDHVLSKGGLCPVGQASVLGLYDSRRLRQPLKRGQQVPWEEVDRDIAAQLAAIRERNGAVRFLTDTVSSPTRRAAIARFLATFKDARHVVYDPLSSSAILDAHERTHGVRALPHYRFDRAEVIASFDADFLGTWISPAEFTAGWAAGRRLDGKAPRYSYHAQFEARLSITGTKADKRIVVAPAEIAPALAALAARIERLAGAAPLAGAASKNDARYAAVLDDLGRRLWEARGRSLVVSGSQELTAQAACNYINRLLGNYGATLDLDRPSYQRAGDDTALAALLDELRAGTVAALFVGGVNPAYDLPASTGFSSALERVPLSVGFSSHTDETAALATFVCPDHHPLESWDDAEPVAGIVSVTQPAMRPAGATRAFIESLAAWAGKPATAYDQIREHWRAQFSPRQTKAGSFDTFWDQAVHDGCVGLPVPAASPKPFNMAAVTSLLAQAPSMPADPGNAANGHFTLVLYAKAGMLDGRHAHNAWLQELPDPVTKVTWDNYASLAPAAAARLGVTEGDVIRITSAGGPALELPVQVQPGQYENVVAVALGYGRKGTDRFADVGPRWLEARKTTGANNLVGTNAAPLLALEPGATGRDEATAPSGLAPLTALRYERRDVTLSPTGRRHELACTQSHHHISVPEHLKPAGAAVRPIVQETTLEAFLRDPSSGAPHAHHVEGELWPDDHAYKGYRWGLVVDLNACTGCSACVVACQAENNIPVVGKDEVRRRRSMQWLRVDRYYSEKETDEPPASQADTAAAGDSSGVSVAHQPMMCAQCGNAACETVCPVLATVHSSDGLNLQVYNRCVGTRYCANNCPLKARRFNWFDYPRNDRLQNLVLNPDVTVRTRGVMEKCTFCVQRVQEAKIAAKQRGERVADGAVQTACQQSCPAQAIVFGDLNDPASRAERAMKDPRRYRVLEEINLQPAVGYLRIVRNREGEPGGKQGGEHHG